MELKEYPQRKNWTFSRLRIGSVVVRFFRNLFTSECPKCKKGRVRYIGDDWTGHTWISVYECNKCKNEFV